MTQDKSGTTISYTEQSTKLPDPTGRETSAQIRNRLGEVDSSRPNTNEKRRLSLTIPVRKVDLLSWLSSRKGFPRFYWRNRERDVEIAAVGKAAEIAASNRGQLINALNGFGEAAPIDSAEIPTSYLTVPFDIDSNNHRVASNSATLITPRIQLVRRGAEYFLSVNADTNYSKLDEIAGELQTPIEGIAELLPCKVLRRTDSPDQLRWGRNIAAVLDAEKQARVGKVVLARKTQLQLNESPDPYALLARMRAANSSAFAFLVQPDEKSTFLGVSPERLFKLAESQLITEAIAGTAPRGETPEQDRRLAEELLHSAKNLSEQRFVIDAVKSAIEKYCNSADTQVISPEILKQSRVQHLITRFSGVLGKSARLGDLFSHLFPTPAVCGAPRTEAFELIRELDGFDRGLYAGIVGIINPNEAEFTVAIRSAHLQGSEMTLFAGAGIVPGSDAALEWDELDHKLATVLAVLGGSNGSDGSLQ